jgi:hypothetical protein
MLASFNTDRLGFASLPTHPGHLRNLRVKLGHLRQSTSRCNPSEREEQIRSSIVATDRIRAVGEYTLDASTARGPIRFARSTRVNPARGRRGLSLPPSADSAHHVG